MLLTLTCEAESATDLGYLLHKNPAALFEKELWFGRARVFYPEAEERLRSSAGIAWKTTISGQARCHVLFLP